MTRTLYYEIRNIWDLEQISAPMETAWYCTDRHTLPTPQAQQSQAKHGKG